MGSTNKTSIGLSQFIATDKPSWLGDYNGDMRTISKEIDELTVNTSSVIAGKLTLIDTQIANLTDDVLKNTNDIAVNTTSIASLAVRMADVEMDIKSLDQRETDHYNAVTKNLDTHTADLKTLEDRQTYFSQNMDRIEDMAVLSTASIAKMDIRLVNAETEIANLKEETDLLSEESSNTVAKLDAVETQTRANTADIAKHEDTITEHDTSISALEQSVAALETSAEQIPKNTDAITELQGKMTDAETSIQGNSTDIDTLQEITKNMSSGVQIPFGFGVDADGKQGYLSPNGTLNPFVTPQEYMDLQDDINGNTTDISDLKDHVKNITAGASLPFSLGIAPGGAYGYIKNGELGVTPWVEESEVAKIVDLQPIQANVQTLTSDVGVLQTTVDAHGTEIQEVQTSVQTVSADLETLQETVNDQQLINLSHVNGTLNIYISTHGDDNNDGLSMGNPIKTSARLGVIINQNPAFTHVVHGIEQDTAIEGNLNCNSILVFAGFITLKSCTILAKRIVFADNDSPLTLTIDGIINISCRDVRRGQSSIAIIAQGRKIQKYIAFYGCVYNTILDSIDYYQNIDGLEVRLNGSMILNIADGLKAAIIASKSIVNGNKDSYTLTTDTTNVFLTVE